MLISNLKKRFGSLFPYQSETVSPTKKFLLKKFLLEDTNLGPPTISFVEFFELCNCFNLVSRQNFCFLSKVNAGTWILLPASSIDVFL